MNSFSESEGEIVESDSEKATTSLPSINGTSVDRHSRNRLSASRSPAALESTNRYRSRSPNDNYRPRGEKRRHDDDYHTDRSRPDSRRFNVHYEERSRDIDRRHRVSYQDLDGENAPNSYLPYDDRDPHDRYRDKRARTRSRSPPSHGRREGFRSRYEQERGRERIDIPYRSDRTPRKSDEHSNKQMKGQSSGRDHLSAGDRMPDKETPNGSEQRSFLTNSSAQRTESTFTGQDKVPDAEDQAPAVNSQSQDEASLIEERRRRREAIKAKYKSQATPLLVQALHVGNEPAPSPANSETSDIGVRRSASPRVSPPHTPKEGFAPGSPIAFTVVNDEELANIKANGTPVTRDDEPSAADYDPTMDMREDNIRNEKRHQGEEVSSGAYDENKISQGEQNVLLPRDTSDGKPTKKAKDDFDMFAEDDEEEEEEEEDESLTSSAAPGMNGAEDQSKAVPIPQGKALDVSMLDNWDDHEGYYRVILGELLDGRYHVKANLGKGMFSGVVRAVDTKTQQLVAIKLIRNNETMKKAGMKEIDILQKLVQADPEDKKHMIRLERYFEHKNHLCMVFENLSINLREVLKKFGRDVGINLKAVRAYAQQMFLGLSLLRKCNILHADLKPDNILVNENRNVLKICDLGSASDASDNEITPYLVSRFYRAPEIMLGMPYDFAIDTWSVGCTLYELYTGKILFTGRSNNQMLRSIMECRGKFNPKMLRRSQFAGLHFDDMLNFLSVEKDKLTGKDVVKVLNFTKPTRDLRTRLISTAKGLDDVEMKELSLFADLLDRCLSLNPERRCTPGDALKHPFITRARG